MSESLIAARSGVSLIGRIRRLIGVAPDVPKGRLLRKDGRFEDCAGDCGEGGMYCCDGSWAALRGD